MKKLILCDLETEENGFDYDCPKLDSYDGYSDYDDPCSDCSHRCHKEVMIEEKPGMVIMDNMTNTKLVVKHCGTDGSGEDVCDDGVNKCFFNKGGKEGCTNPFCRGFCFIPLEEAKKVNHKRRDNGVLPFINVHKQQLETGTRWVLMESAMAAGVVDVWVDKDKPTEATIYNLDVTLEYRMRNIGYALMQKAFDICRKNGIEKITLQVEYNTWTERWYKRLAFKRTSREWDSERRKEMSTMVKLIVPDTNEQTT